MAARVVQCPGGMLWARDQGVGVLAFHAYVIVGEGSLSSVDALATRRRVVAVLIVARVAKCPGGVLLCHDLMFGIVTLHACVIVGEGALTHYATECRVPTPRYVPVQCPHPGTSPSSDRTRSPSAPVVVWECD